MDNNTTLMLHVKNLGTLIVLICTSCVQMFKNTYHFGIFVNLVLLSRVTELN